MIKQALSVLKQKGAAGCVVLGEPNYYGKFGFTAHAPLFYAGVPAEYFQAHSFCGQTPTEEVKYHESFNATASIQVYC